MSETIDKRWFDYLRDERLKFSKAFKSGAEDTMMELSDMYLLRVFCDWLIDHPFEKEPTKQTESQP